MDASVFLKKVTSTSTFAKRIIYLLLAKKREEGSASESISRGSEGSQASSERENNSTIRRFTVPSSDLIVLTKPHKLLAGLRGDGANSRQV